MSKVLPVKIEWGLGCNDELCRFLSDCKSENPDFAIDCDYLVEKIKMYGRGKDVDGNDVTYDSLYLDECEAANVIYTLVYHMMTQYMYLGKYKMDTCDCKQCACKHNVDVIFPSRYSTLNGIVKFDISFPFEKPVYNEDFLSCLDLLLKEFGKDSPLGGALSNFDRKSIEELRNHVIDHELQFDSNGRAVVCSLSENEVSDLIRYLLLAFSHYKASHEFEERVRDKLLSMLTSEQRVEFMDWINAGL